MSGGGPLRRFLRGAVAAYRRFLLTADPAHRFHCWATIQAVSAGLERLERVFEKFHLGASRLSMRRMAAKSMNASDVCTFNS